MVDAVQVMSERAVSEGEGLEVGELRRASQFPADISCHGWRQ